MYNLTQYQYDQICNALGMMNSVFLRIRPVANDVIINDLRNSIERIEDSLSDINNLVEAESQSYDDYVIKWYNQLGIKHTTWAVQDTDFEEVIHVPDGRLCVEVAGFVVHFNTWADTITIGQLWKFMDTHHTMWQHKGTTIEDVEYYRGGVYVRINR